MKAAKKGASKVVEEREEGGCQTSRHGVELMSSIERGFGVLGFWPGRQRLESSAHWK